MSSDPSVLAGARQIVQHCLGLEPYQHLVIFVDESTVDPGVALAEAAEFLGVAQTVLLVPMSIQRQIPGGSDLSLFARGVAREARAILTCVNSTPQCLPFRQRILESSWSARTRVGHMPGASLQVLKLADVDYEKLVADCRNMEVAMACGRRLELVTETAGGDQCTLRVDLAGWERLPVASDGVISDGAWGNVPSGETYIAPVEGRGDGLLVINGSVPGRVIEPGEELVLTFERGRLRRIDPPDGPVAHWLQETQFHPAQAQGDLNWSNLAEIGVGMNPAVDGLTGNMLFDEKAAGTAHIALGSNTFMGGVVEATIHCDLVTQRPTILIDGKEVLDRGNLCYVESDWHEHHADVSLTGSPLRTANQAARTGMQATGSSDGRLQRVLRPEPGRVSTCFVGHNETARIAQGLYTLLPDDGEWLPIERVATEANINLDLAHRVLHVMWSYDLVRAR